jgi:hypothetical protein
MYPIEVLPEDLRAKSYSSRDIILDFPTALLAVDILAAAGWAVWSWEGRVLIADELRTFHDIRYETKNNDLLWRFEVEWQSDESWDEYVARAANLSKTTLGQTRELLNRLTDRAVYFKIEALPPHPYLEKIKGILAKHFFEKKYLTVEATSETVPLVAATVRKGTGSFSTGQVVYIYSVYWGMNEQAKVVGRFRRKHRWIKGVCPIASLDHFRPKIVYNPTIIKTLADETIDSFIFPRFLAMPVASLASDLL